MKISDALQAGNHSVYKWAVFRGLFAGYYAATRRNHHGRLFSAWNALRLAIRWLREPNSSGQQSTDA